MLYLFRNYATKATTLLVKPQRKRRRPTQEERLARAKKKARLGAHITIAAIAKELGRSSRDCRTALRVLKVKRPEHGWAWPKSEAVLIRNKLAKRFGVLPTPPSSLKVASSQPRENRDEDREEVRCDVGHDDATQEHEGVDEGDEAGLDGDEAPSRVH